MNGVMTTPLAIFLHLETIGVVLLVLLRRVIAALALSASQRNQRTHQKTPCVLPGKGNDKGHMNS